MRTINFYIVILFILSACTTMEEAGKFLKMKKFQPQMILVKKRQPLILPPDYDKILNLTLLIKKRIDKIKNT